MTNTIKLNSGYDMPVLGLGTWKSEPGKVGAAVKYAILEAGYQHIDGAASYGNEQEIGRIYGEIFKSHQRDNIFITSKLLNTKHAKDHVKEACKQTLRDLQLDYLDLYLIHWGIAFKSGDNDKPLDESGHALLEPISVRETWEAMQNLVDLGIVKSIGVANFDAPMLVDLLTYAKIKPAINQIELHPYNAQTELVDYCQKMGIVVTAYSPTGRMGVASYDLPRLHEDPLVQNIASKHRKSVAQILIRWAIERGTVVIPKSVTPSRIKENISVFDFELSDSDMAELGSLDRGRRYVDPSQDWGIPYFK